MQKVKRVAHYARVSHDEQAKFGYSVQNQIERLAAHSNEKKHLSFVISWSLLKFMSTELVKLFNHLTLCFPLSPFAFNLPSIRVFSKESVLYIRWPKYWNFSFSISPSNEYSGYIFFRIDWFALLAVQGTLKSPLQYHDSKESILQHLTFFILQLSHPFMTTGKNIALTR